MGSLCGRERGCRIIIFLASNGCLSIWLLARRNAPAECWLDDYDTQGLQADLALLEINTARLLQEDQTMSDTPSDTAENDTPADAVENDDTATEGSSDAEDIPLGPSAPGAESEMESSIEEEDMVAVRRPRNGSIYSEQLQKRLTFAMQHKRGLCTPKFKRKSFAFEAIILCCCPGHSELIVYNLYMQYNIRRSEYILCCFDVVSTKIGLSS